MLFLSTFQSKAPVTLPPPRKGLHSVTAVKRNHLHVCFMCVHYSMILSPKETGFCKADQCGGFWGSQGLVSPSGATLGCLRRSEKVIPVGSSVESYCTMSSPPLPISFVPKLKKHQERREALSTSHTGPTRLLLFRGSAYQISPHSQSAPGKEGQSHHTTVWRREVRHEGMKGLPSHGQHPGPQATGSASFAHKPKRSPMRRVPIITRILTVHNAHLIIQFLDLQNFVKFCAIFHPIGSTLFSYSFQKDPF